MFVVRRSEFLIDIDFAVLAVIILVTTVRISRSLRITVTILEYPERSLEYGVDEGRFLRSGLRKDNLELDSWQREQ